MNNTALVIGTTKEHADDLSKRIKGYEKIITKGERSIDLMDGIKVDAIYIHWNCIERAHQFAYREAAALNLGNIWTFIDNGVVLKCPIVNTTTTKCPFYVPNDVPK